MPIDDLARTDPIAATVFHVASLMREEGVGSVVVDDGKLRGIITFDDLDRSLSDERRTLSDVVRAESPPY